MKTIAAFLLSLLFTGTAHGAGRAGPDRSDLGAMLSLAKVPDACNPTRPVGAAGRCDATDGPGGCSPATSSAAQHCA